MITKYCTAGAAALVLAAASIGAARAEVITEDSGLFNQSSFNSLGTDTLSFAQFDPSLGPLESVTITLTGITQPQFEVLNLGSSAGSGTGSTAVTYTLTGPGIIGLSTPSLSSGPQTVTVPGGLGNLDSSLPGSPQFFDVSISPVDLADYMGPGSIALTLGELFTTSGTPNGIDPVAVGGTASANFDVTVAYDVPEPASIALLGGSLLALGMLRRRRRE